MGAILGILGALAGKVPLKWWFVICALAAAALGIWGGALHERSVGRLECENAVKKARAEEKAKADELQVRIDKMAGEDDRLKKQLAMPPPGAPIIDFTCKFAPSEVDKIKGVLK